jgi:uncharacterized protein YeaO (DUF488 family)
VPGVTDLSVPITGGYSGKFWGNVSRSQRKGLTIHMNVRIQRVYEARSEQDGKRVLVDRLWPRGLSKERAGIDLWLKDIGPSTELRKWFGHEPGRWKEFQKRYRDELTNNAGSLSILKREVDRSPVTLLFGAKDEEHNEAVVLCSVLKDLAA